MNQNALAISLSDSLGAEVTDCLGDIIEAGIDSVMDEGLLQGVPFISTVVSLFRIGRSIHERHQIKKLASFVDEIRRKTVEADKLEEYRQEFLSDEKKRNSELEYIMIIVDTLIGMAVLFNMVRQSITESLREFFITVKIFNAINPVLERLRVRPVNAFPNQDLGLADVNAQPASYRGHRRRNRHRRIHSNTFQITLSQTL